MTLTPAPLPGLCPPTVLQHRLPAMRAEDAFILVARHLFDVAQLVMVDAQGQVEQRVRKDPRFSPCVMLSIDLTLVITDTTRKSAWRRCSQLMSAMKTHGAGGCVGRLAQAALTLGRAVQNMDHQQLGEVIEALDLAAADRAAELKVAPSTYTAGIQSSLLRHLNR
jgi:hypothetical protein